MDIMNYSLISLLQKYSICIPAIQREYVQGFDEELNNKVRENFLNDIFFTLDSESTGDRLKLNIIYGYTEGKFFFPVDGQQRLTTLYLIHWFLWIKSNKKNDKSFTDKEISYEIRQSSNQFFEELINPQRQIEFQKLLNSKYQFKSEIISRSWFKSSWIKDATVLAVLNVISELKERHIGEEKAEKYYAKLEAGKIFFDFLSNRKGDAKKKSIIDYIKLNARGKQLELFENVKAIINTIEKTLEISLENRFVYNYDKKYIDFFYDLYKSDKKSLEQITMEINEYSINFLINSYNLLKSIDEEKEVSLIDSHLKYYSTIYEKSKHSELNEGHFWKKYFVFMNNILKNISVLYKRGVNEKKLKLFWEGIVSFETNYKDSNNLMANLLYYDYYTAKHNNLVSEEINQKFEYVLRNLAYSRWKQKELCNINKFCSEVSKSQDIFKYFSEKLESEIVEDIFLAENDIFINDIKARIKEQVIKAKIIESNKLKYDYFNDLEDVFNENRSIYFLLYFSGYWKYASDNPLDGDYRKLEKYMDIAKELFKSKATNYLRKIFAIVTYYDAANGKLLDPFTINKKAGYAYILEKKEEQNNVLDLNNLHYWDDTYYFIKDNMSKKDINLRNIKLNKLKIAYELFEDEQENEVNIKTLMQLLEDDSYNCCWLKYAIDRTYEELLTFHTTFDSATKKVNIEVPVKKGLAFNTQKNSVNFFAYVYLLDKKMEGWDINKYDSYIYDPYTVNVRDTIFRGEYVVYSQRLNNAINNKLSSKIINQFKLKLLWEGEYEEYLNMRSFFYYKYSLNIYGDSDALISIENDIIVKRIFNLNDYIEYYFDFTNERRDIEKRINTEDNNINEIKGMYEQCLWKKNENSLEELELNSEYEKINDFINKNYDCIKSYSKGDYRVSKYLSRQYIKKNCNNVSNGFKKGDEKVLV